MGQQKPNFQTLMFMLQCAKYNFGLQASANWKGFDFSMNWSGAAGFKIYYYRLALNSSATIKGYAIGEAIAN